MGVSERRMEELFALASGFKVVVQNAASVKF